MSERRCRPVASPIELVNVARTAAQNSKLKTRERYGEKRTMLAY